MRTRTSEYQSPKDREYTASLINSAPKEAAAFLNLKHAAEQNDGVMSRREAIGCPPHVAICGASSSAPGTSSNSTHSWSPCFGNSRATTTSLGAAPPWSTRTSAATAPMRRPALKARNCPRMLWEMLGVGTDPVLRSRSQAQDRIVEPGLYGDWSNRLALFGSRIVRYRWTASPSGSLLPHDSSGSTPAVSSC
jgi:hypothetical protein